MLSRYVPTAKRFPAICIVVKKIKSSTTRKLRETKFQDL
jgi:hypothetical protein